MRFNVGSGHFLKPTLIGLFNVVVFGRHLSHLLMCSGSVWCIKSCLASFFLMEGHISMRLNLRSLDPHDCLGHHCGASWRLMAVCE